MRPVHALLAAALALPCAAQMDPDAEPVTIGNFSANSTLEELIREHCLISVDDDNVVNAFGRDLVAHRTARFDSAGQLQRVLWFFDKGQQGRPHLVVVNDLVEAIEGHLGIDLIRNADNDPRSTAWDIDRQIYVAAGPEGSGISRIQVKVFADTVRLRIDFNEGEKATTRICLSGVRETDDSTEMTDTP